MILRDSLGLYGAKLGVGAEGFFAWWRSALASWLPARWRVLFGMSSDRLLLTPMAGELRLRWARGSEVRDLGDLPAEDIVGNGDPLASMFGPGLLALPRWLILPSSSGLRRRLLLPAAAADRLRDVLGFEIERQTPFAAADVVFDGAVAGRRSDGQLEVELLTVPRTGFEAAIAALGGLADSLAGVDVADGAGVPLGVNLLPLSRRYRPVDPWRPWNWALTAVAILALAIGLWQTLENRRVAADQLQREVAGRSAAARRVALQRQQLKDVIQGAAFLDRSRSGRPTMVEIIDELSRRLPDNTYLEKLAVEDNRLLLIGLSSEASALVARLEGSPLWRSPALTGALQPDPRTHRDRFTLTAELAVSGPAANQAPGSASVD